MTAHARFSPGPIYLLDDLPDELLRDLIRKLLDHMGLDVSLVPVEKSTVGALEVRLEVSE